MQRKEVKIFGKRVMLTLRNEGDWAIAHELFLDHQYRFCDEVIRRALNPIIDIGGHLGFFSLYAALLNPRVPIYSFEPHEGNFALLKKNLKNNHIKNVVPKCLAVTSRVGQTTLHLSKEDLNHSTTRAIEPTGETKLVQTATLERIFEKNRINQCDLVKLDCEGAEFEILYSTPKAIFDKVSHIFLEYHDWVTPLSSRAEVPLRRDRSRGTCPASDKLKRFLENRGFKVQKYPNHKISELGFLWCAP